MAVIEGISGGSGGIGYRSVEPTPRAPAGGPPPDVEQHDRNRQADGFDEPPPPPPVDLLGGMLRQAVDWASQNLAATARAALDAAKNAGVTVPRPTPPAPPTPGPVYSRGMTEAQLAAYQQDQGARNDCAEYSIAAALNMLYGGAVQGSDVAAAADQVIRDHIFPFSPPWAGTRIWQNGPTTPGQQANIVNAIARQGRLPLSATHVQATTTDLVNYLRQPDTAVIVTIRWDAAHLNSHAMLLSAYDPSHVDQNGNPAPWGFVNSLAPSGTQIYWMSGAAFENAWGLDLFPGLGSKNAVVITKTPAASATATPAATPEPPDRGR